MPLVIHARFKQLADKANLAGWHTRGVYVNIGRKSGRTVRVGEGWVDERASLSWRRGDQMVACALGHGDGPKKHGEIVEWAMLRLLEKQSGCLPVRNVIRGKGSIVYRELRRHGSIHVVLSGWDPFSGKRLSDHYLLRIEWNRGGDFDVYGPQRKPCKAVQDPGPLYGGLKKAWRGYHAAKGKGDVRARREYEGAINRLQVALGFEPTTF